MYHPSSRKTLLSNKPRKLIGVFRENTDTPYDVAVLCCE